MKLKNVLLNFRKLTKSMFKFTHGRKEDSGDYGTLKKQEQLKEELALSKLLSFETIKAKTFYQIQNMLIEKKKEALNLLGNASLQIQEKAWSKIVERYYKEIDEDAFNSFLSKYKNNVLWEGELLQMTLAFHMAEIGIEEGFKSLEKLGITGDIKTLERKIRGKITNRELRNKKKIHNSEDKKVNYFSMVANVEKMGYKVPNDILLERWAGILNSIKDERDNTKN